MPGRHREPLIKMKVCLNGCSTVSSDANPGFCTVAEKFISPLVLQIFIYPQLTPSLDKLRSFPVIILPLLPCTPDHTAFSFSLFCVNKFGGRLLILFSNRKNFFSVICLILIFLFIGKNRLTGQK